MPLNLQSYHILLKRWSPRRIEARTVCGWSKGRADIKKDVRLHEPTTCAKALRKAFVSEAIDNINRATCRYQQEASKIISKSRHHT